MWRSALVSVLVLGAPAAAQETEFNLYFGATVATEYVSNGIRYSDGLVLQPYVELGFGGLYAGAYISKVDEILTGASTENGLSLGYRGEAGSVSYDIGLAYYIYDDAFPRFPAEDSGEAYVFATLAASDRLYLTAEAVVAPEYDQTGLSLRADYDTAVEGLSVGAIVGRVQSNYGDWTYWSLDAAYAVADTVSLSLAYHDTNLDPALGLADSDGLFVAALSFDFSLR